MIKIENKTDKTASHVWWDHIENVEWPAFPSGKNLQITSLTGHKEKKISKFIIIIFFRKSNPARSEKKLNCDP